MSKKKRPIEEHEACSLLWITQTGDTITAEGKEPDLAEIVKFVGGDIERVTLFPNEHFVFVNEDGRRLGLKYNAKASEIAGQTLLGSVVFVRKMYPPL